MDNFEKRISEAALKVKAKGFECRSVKIDLCPGCGQFKNAIVFNLEAWDVKNEQRVVIPAMSSYKTPQRVDENTLMCTYRDAAGNFCGNVLFEQW